VPATRFGTITLRDLDHAQDAEQVERGLSSQRVNPVIGKEASCRLPSGWA
jgi:hypothetical protein